MFVVGRDINKSNKNHLIDALNSGHEIANHSFSHCANFSSLSKEDFVREIRMTNEAIKTNLGYICKGFKAPNFNVSLSQLELLKQEGIQYDSSILMTPFCRVLKWIKRRDAEESDYLCDSYKQGSMFWSAISCNFSNLNNVVEIPISVFPIFKFPCHFSYLLATNKYLACKIMRTLINWHIKNDNDLVYLFHLADIVGNEFLRGTELKLYKSLEERLFLLDMILEMFSENFSSLTTYEYLNFKRNMQYE